MNAEPLAGRWRASGAAAPLHRSGNAQPGVTGESQAKSPVAEQASEGIRGWTPPRLLRQLAADGSGLEAELIEAFKTDTATRLERLHDAITKNDATRLRMEAHTIKGSAWQMGADTVASMCQELEAAAGETPLSRLNERMNRLDAHFAEVCRAMTMYTNTSKDCACGSR